MILSSVRLSKWESYYGSSSSIDVLLATRVLWSSGFWSYQSKWSIGNRTRYQANAQRCSSGLRQSPVVHPRRHSPGIPRWTLLFENRQEIRLLLYSIPSGNGPQECQNTYLLCRSRKNCRRTGHLLRRSIMTLRKMLAKTRNMIQWRSGLFINASLNIYPNYRVSSYVAQSPPFLPRALSAQHLSLDAKNVLVSVQPTFDSQCFSRTRWTISRTRETASYRVALMKTLLQMSIEFVRVE